jgi:tRNA-binding EMAP/Myf-like protein
MKLTLPWLKEHLATEASLGEIVEQLTMLGLEVEAVEKRGADLSPFRVAQVTDVRPHPDAERLSLCRVDTGEHAVEVVCGAPNVHAGMKAVFAPVGAVIPGSGEVLKRARIRGVESNGMLCSAGELLLGEDYEGIIELAADAPVGRPASEAIKVEGPIIEVAVTPNRSDCFGSRSTFPRATRRHARCSSVACSGACATDRARAGSRSASRRSVCARSRRWSTSPTWSRWISAGRCTCSMPRSCAATSYCALLAKVSAC